MQNYHRYEVNDDTNEINVPNKYSLNNNETATSRSFELKSKVLGRTPDNNNTLHTEVIIPLKFFE